MSSKQNHSLVKYERQGNEVRLQQGNGQPQVAWVLGEDVAPNGAVRIWLDRRVHSPGDIGNSFIIYGAMTSLIEFSEGATSND